jgi:signal peptide peptidase SppA
MFFAVCGILLALFLFAMVYSFFSGSALIEPKTTMNILPDASGKRELTSMTAPAILQLNIHGVIGDPKNLDSSTVENILLDSRTGLLANDRVKGILIHFNTPGGTVVDSDNIYRMLMDYKARYKVPIFAYVDGLCASGGMYISSSAEKIFASPPSIVGSIGVIIGPFFNIYDSLQKIGTQTKTLTEGIGKDAMSPFHPWKEGEESPYKALNIYYYDRFVQIVTSARPRLDKDKLIHEYGAHVFDPIRAEEYGYIDKANASRDDALLALLEAAKIDPSKPYQVVELQPRSEWLSELFSGKNSLLTGKIEHSLDLGQPKICDQFAYLYQPR